jgi:lactate dehydrogenase-like 2-hydroxyacid dehydrogenase
MSEILLVTEAAYAKGEAIYRAAAGLEVQAAPPNEDLLAEKLLACQSRAVIVGAQPYRGPLYTALGRTGGSQGAILARFGVGHDGIDKTLARQHRIVVTNTPGVLDVSVAEHALWLIGSLARRLPSSDARLRAGQYTPEIGGELRGRTLGVVGFGAIGRRVAAMAHGGFAMRVIAADPRPLEQLEREAQRSFAELQAAWGLDRYTSDIDEVFYEADVVTLHLPATPQTHHFVDARRLARMKPQAFLVNTARGSVVDEAALYDALASGRLAGAGLDVFEHEPYQPVHPDKDLRTLDTTVLTPHVASNTREANRGMARVSLENVVHFFAGQMERLNRVDVQ